MKRAAKNSPKGRALTSTKSPSKGEPVESGNTTVCLKLFETTLFSQKSSLAQPSQIVYLLDRVKTA